MKSFLAGLALLLMLVGAAPMEAQDQYPPQAQQQPSQTPPLPSPQSPPPQSQQPGQPQPGVARISFLNGEVSTQRGDNGQWASATVNTPLEQGDRLSTGQQARAEVQLDYADILRLSDNATANIATLSRTKIQLQVGQGLTTLSVLKGSEADPEIDTPNAAIHPLGEGEYRILVNSDAETQVVVRNGSAEVSTPQGTTRIEKGQMITVAGTDNPQYKTDPAPGRDEWDSWNNNRDKAITSAESWQHTDRYYTGSEDLDSYGVWTEVPDYGPVWQPRVEAGWAPYRTGRWVYEPFYGWTWVSYEPWGWAPYHYGRWFVYGGNWLWWPGPIAAYPGYYPIWAPAYVSFFGFGGGGWGFGVGFGFGRFGWLPIGPGDWFHPWYGGWGGRYGVVNMNNFSGIHDGFAPLGRGGRGFSNINEAFQNDRVRSGFSSMAGNEFGRGAVAAHQQAISSESFRQASALAGRMPVTPSRESFSPTDRSPGASTIRNGAPGSQRFFSSSRTASGGSGFANRSAGSFESRGASAASPQGNTRGGWSSFNGRAGDNSFSRSSASPSGGGQGNWERYTPSSRDLQRQGSSRSFSSPGGLQRQSVPPSAASRGNYGSSNSYSRPTLNMRQPIVTPRSGSSSGYGSGSPRSRSSGSGPRGGGGHSSGGHSR